MAALAVVVVMVLLVVVDRAVLVSLGVITVLGLVVVDMGLVMVMLRVLLVAAVGIFSFTINFPSLSFSMFSGSPRMSCCMALLVFKRSGVL